MNEDPDLIDNLVKRGKEISLAYIELFKLKAIDRFSKIISAILPDLIVTVLFLIFLLFLNLGLAFWLGYVLGKTYLGFLAVALFYLLLGFLAHFFLRNSLKKAVANYIIRQFFR